jgi:glycine cleavage system H protein
MAISRFTRDHEWIRVDGDEGVIGITTFAQKQLGDVVFVELPEIGRQVRQGEEAAVVESVKAASEVYAPASGEVIDVNVDLAEDPGRVNGDAEGAGWFFRIRLSDPGELDALMDAEAYNILVESLA